jgi:hypothetical protein
MRAFQVPPFAAQANHGEEEVLGVRFFSVSYCAGKWEPKPLPWQAWPRIGGAVRPMLG